FGSWAGVPVAVFGAIWFAAALLIIVAGGWGPASVRDNAVGYLFAFATIGLSVVLYLAYASFFVLKTLCIFCLATYVAVVAIFIFWGALTSSPMPFLPRRVAQAVRVGGGRPLAIAVPVFFLGAAASAVPFSPGGGGVPAAPAAPLTQA